VEIALGKGLVAVIDDEDAGLVAGFKWYAMKAPQAEEKFYAAGWKHLPPGRFFVLLHRLIMNAQPDQVVDHVDRNPLNCRRSNLRFATWSQNNHNRSRCRRPKTTPYRGVFLDRTHGVYKAAITANGKRQYLGTFASAEEGARAWNKKAQELFGEFAFLNDVPDGDRTASSKGELGSIA
jgi:HNH endonuclease